MKPIANFDIYRETTRFFKSWPRFVTLIRDDFSGLKIKCPSILAEPITSMREINQSKGHDFEEARLEGV